MTSLSVSTKYECKGQERKFEIFFCRALNSACRLRRRCPLKRLLSCIDSAIAMKSSAPFSLLTTKSLGGRKPGAPSVANGWRPGCGAGGIGPNSECSYRQ